MQLYPNIVRKDLAEDDVKEQDRVLPAANISRIMKRGTLLYVENDCLALPENAKIAKDAKECVQDCVSEFISFITSEASERCLFEKRKTITGEDILFAMQTLGFDNYFDALKIYLHKYREATKVEKPITGNEGVDNSVSAYYHQQGQMVLPGHNGQQHLHPLQYNYSQQ